MTSYCHLRPGEVVADYQVVRLLGSGAEGSVYKVRDLRNAATRTIKILRGRNMMAEAEHTAAHYQKLKSITSLKRFYEWGVLTGQKSVGSRPWLAFDYLSGATLSRRIAERRISDPLSTLIAVCDALAPIHQLGFAIGDFDHGRNIILESGTRLIKFCDLDAGTPEEPPPDRSEDLEELLSLARLMYGGRIGDVPPRVRFALTFASSIGVAKARLQKLQRP